MIRKKLKGTVFSIDAILASLAVVMIAYIGFIVFSEMASGALEAQKSEERDAKLLLVSDYLIKEGAVEQDGARVYQHQVRVDRMEKLDLEGLAKKIGVDRIGVRLLLGEKDVFSKGSGSDCLRRAVWSPDYGQVGYLETCIE